MREQGDNLKDEIKPPLETLSGASVSCKYSHEKNKFHPLSILGCKIEIASMRSLLMSSKPDIVLTHTCALQSSANCFNCIIEAVTLKMICSIRLILNLLHLIKEATVGLVFVD